MNEMPITLNIERRNPIVKPEELSEVGNIGYEWALFTKAVKREILSHPEVRQSLREFSTKPVSESLANEAVQLLAQKDDQVARLVKRYEKSLGVYLSLAAVPDDQINPDVRHAPSLPSPEQVAMMLQNIYEKDNSQYSKELQAIIDLGYFLRGITEEERSLILTRYAFARDVKLLALGAEILDQGSGIEFDEAGEIVLPSGIRMVVNSSDPEVRSDFLNPHVWEKRKQFKDRIYEIEISGRKYLLKEKKTARHRDTRKGGHTDGRSSSEEFAVAKHFQDHGTVNQGVIGLVWERPVGFVEYPDGFQFSVFEFEEELEDSSEVNRLLIEGIVSHRKQFENEYALLSSLVKKFKDSPELSAFQSKNSVRGLRAIMPWLRRARQEDPEPLTFDGFARVKALHMERRARRLMEEVILDLGYENFDTDGYAYQIRSDENKFGLEIVGFDFEYYRKVSTERAAELKAMREKYDSMLETRRNIGSINWDDGQSVTLTERAVYLVLLEVEGLLYKPKEF